MQPDLEQRLQRLERQNRLLRGVGLCLIAVVIGAMTTAGKATSKVPDEIVARAIRVVGEHGQNSATLEATSDGFVGIFFRDLKGALRFTILMTPSGKPTIAFFGEPKGPRLELGVVDGPAGEEFSMSLLNVDHSVAWHPPVQNLLTDSPTTGK